MNKLSIVSLWIFISSYAGAEDVINPLLQNPVISDTDLQVRVSFSPGAGIYTYQYSLASGASNLGNIVNFGIDLVTEHTQDNVYDPDLYSDQTRRDGPADGAPAPKRSVPIGLQSPGPDSLWYSAVSIVGEVNWGSINQDAYILPAQTMDGYVLHAKAPPGPRDYTIDPYFQFHGFPSDDENQANWPHIEDFRITGTTIGPVLKSELKLFDDKGLPAAPDAFLAYSNPAQAPTVLPAGRNKFDLAVYYGKTITPASFTATLINTATVTELTNGTVLTSQFHPIPGGFDVVRLNLQKGENILVLSMAGTRPNGALGIKQDVALDKLVFIVQ